VSNTAELTHLFRALKAPAAARALPKLVERARTEEWSYERFAEALLSTEISSRESSGGRLRIRAARFPSHKTLEEFDFTFQRSVKNKWSSTSANSTSCTPKRTSSCWAHPEPARPTWRQRSASAPASPGSASSLTRDRVGRAPRRRATPRTPRRRAQTPRTDPAFDLRRGRLHPVRPPSREPVFMLVSRRYERAPR